jgi:hypothetical protein
VKRGSEKSFGKVQRKEEVRTVLETCSEKRKGEQFWNCAVKRRSENSLGTVQ